MVIRVDLADCLMEDVARPLARTIASHLRSDGAQSAIVVGVGDNRENVQTAMSAMRENLRIDVANVTLALIVNGRVEYQSDLCGSTGREVPGLVHRCTDLLGGGVEHDPSLRTKVSRAQQRWRQRRSPDPVAWRVDSWEAWRYARDAVTNGVQLDPPAIGRLIAGLADIAVRDAVVVAMTDGGDALAEHLVRGGNDEEVSQALSSMTDIRAGVAPRLEAAQSVMDLCANVAASSARQYRTPVLTIAAIMMWWAGSPVCAKALLAHALHEDPHYVLARLIDEVVDHGIEPGWLARTSLAEQVSAPTQ